MTTYRAWNLKPLDRSALKELTAAIAQQSTEELESRAMETMDGEPWSEEKYQMTLAAQQKEAGLLAGILAVVLLHLGLTAERLLPPLSVLDPDAAPAAFYAAHAPDRHGQGLCPHPRCHRPGGDHCCLW